MFERCPSGNIPYIVLVKFTLPVCNWNLYKIQLSFVIWQQHWASLNHCCLDPFFWIQTFNGNSSHATSTSYPRCCIPCTLANTDLPSFPMNLTLLFCYVNERQHMWPWDSSLFHLPISQDTFLLWPASGVLSPFWKCLLSFYTYTSLANAFISWPDIVFLNFCHYLQCSSEFFGEFLGLHFKHNFIYQWSHNIFILNIMDK